MIHLSDDPMSLFVVGDVEPIRKALRAVLPVDRFVVEGTSVEDLPWCLEPVHSAIVVAATPSAWRTLRPANTWPSISTLVRGNLVFGDQPSGDSPSILRATSISARTLSDALLAGEGPVGLLRAVLQGNEQQDDRAVFNLVRAALRRLTLERHNVPVADQPGVGSHQVHDAHAALRTIHGATLAGWMSAESGRRTYDRVCKQAAPDENIPSLDGNWPGTGVFDTSAIESLPSWNRSPPQGAIGRIVVVDDQPFWETTLDGLWSPFGFEVERVERPQEIQRASRAGDEEEAATPIRAVVLDLKHPSDPFAGGKFLAHLRSDFPHVPVVVLSAEDQFSSTVLLKRKGAFLYVSKHPEAQVQGYRDEVTAFGQLRDAILFSTFASLKELLNGLWDALEQWRSDSEDDTYARAAFDTLFRECQTLFHNVWQGPASNRGLVCRQIIRGFGLANDKWCEGWSEVEFDPDGEWEPWAKEKTSPLRTYHYVTTQLRNEASHAMTSDACFTWLDVWIMVLTFVLKVEGLARRVEIKPQAQEGRDDSRRLRGLKEEQLDTGIRSFIHPLRHLLIVSGYLHLRPDGNNRSVSDTQGKLASLCSWREEYGSSIERGNWGEYLPAAIAERERVAVAPYVLRARETVPLIYEPSCLEVVRTTAQDEADMLLFDLIASRISSLER